MIQLVHYSNWSVVWRSFRHGWLLASWWCTLIKQSSSLHLLLLTISTLNISPSSLMKLKSKALLLFKTLVLFLTLTWRWVITLPNFLAPWTSKSGLQQNQTVLGFQFLPQCCPFPHPVQVGLLWCPLQCISQKDITRLQRIQNRCVRMIFKKTQTHSFLFSS